MASPRHVTPAIQAAAQLLAEGDAEGAAVRLEALTNAAPAYPAAHALLARAYEATGRVDEALSAWHQAHVLVPNSPLVQRERQRLLEARAAEEVAEHADARPADTEAHASHDPSAPETPVAEPSQDPAPDTARADEDMAPGHGAAQRGEEETSAEEAGASRERDGAASKEGALANAPDGEQPDLHSAFAPNRPASDEPEAEKVEAPSAWHVPFSGASAETETADSDALADAEEPEVAAPRLDAEDQDGGADDDETVWKPGREPAEGGENSEDEVGWTVLKEMQREHPLPSSSEALVAPPLGQDEPGVPVEEDSEVIEMEPSEVASERAVHPAAAEVIPGDEALPEEAPPEDAPPAAAEMDVEGEQHTADENAALLETPADVSPDPLPVGLEETAEAEPEDGTEKAVSEGPVSEKETQDVAVPDDLDALIRQLEEAPRIRPDPDFNAPAVAFNEEIADDMVSETLARIYASQRQYAQAAVVYEKLAQQKPNEAEALLQKAAELRARDA